MKLFRNERLAIGAALPLKADASSRLLPGIVGIMIFLAVLATAAALLVGGAARHWQRSLTGAATVQILPPPEGASPEVLSQRVAAAVALLQNTPGVQRAQPLEDSAAADLLTPWLGDIAMTGSLPLPRLIDVSFQPGLVDVDLLRGKLMAVPGASLDDHVQWAAGLRAAARMGTLGSIGLLLIIGGGTVLTVVFATRSALIIQRDVIEVLHLIGARDGYIAAGLARQAVIRTLVGGGTGGGLALLLLAGLTFAGLPGGIGLLEAGGLGPFDWAVLVLVPVLAAVLAGVTAQITAMRVLTRMV